MTGKTPLTVVVEKGHQETVAALVKAGADPNVALAAATEAGQAWAVTALVKAGADPSLPDAQTGKTPLTVAVEKGHQETVAALLHALLEVGVDLSVEPQSPDADLAAGTVGNSTPAM